MGNQKDLGVPTLKLDHTDKDVNKTCETVADTKFKDMTFGKKISFLKNHITVEPFLVCYLLPITLSGLTVQNMDIEKACRVNLNFSSEICDAMMNQKFDDLKHEINAIQTLVTEIIAWKTPLSTAIPALMILFVGAWSDRTGNRKACMMIPIIGEIVSKIGLLFCTYYFLELPLEAAAIFESVPPALTGGLPTVLMGMYCYMADITTEEERTFRIGIVTLILTLSLPIGTALSGILHRELGYYGVFSIAICFYVIGFIYGYYKLKIIGPRENSDGEKRNVCLEFFAPKHIYDTLIVAVKNRPGTRRARLLMVLLVYIVIVGPLLGEGPVLYLYTINKFQFSEVDFSVYSTYFILIGFVGTSIAITLFSKVMGLDDTMLGVIAGVSRILACFVFALAPTWQWFYLGPVVDMFSHVAVTAIRSIGTKLVEIDEIGKVSSLIGISEALVPIVYSPMYSRVYIATLETLPGAFYFIGGALTLPALVIFITMYFLQKKDKNTVNDSDKKESYAYDNEITAL